MNRSGLITEDEFLAMGHESYRVGSFYNALVVRTNHDRREVISVLRYHHIKQNSQENQK